MVEHTVTPKPGPRPTPGDLAGRPAIDVDKLDRMMVELLADMDAAAVHPHGSDTAPGHTTAGNIPESIADTIAARTELIQRAHEQLSAALSATPTTTRGAAAHG